MQKYWNFVLNERGEPRSGASVSVQQSGSNATVYQEASGTTVKPNPITTDVRGYFEFFGSGEYDLVVSGHGFAEYTITSAVDLTAAGLGYTPTGTISSTNTQDAVAEVDTSLTAHLDDTAGAHASSAISFAQSGTGASTRDLQEKVREIVSVTDFENDDGTAVGADPGVQDDTTGAQAAMDAVHTAGGGRVWNPTRLKVSSLTPKQGVYWEGNGVDESGNSSSEFVGTAGSDIFSYNDAAAFAYFGVKGIKFNGGRRGFYVGSTPSNFIHLQLENVWFATQSESAVRAECHIERWRFDHIRMESGQYGFYYDGPLLDKCTFINVRTAGQTVNGWYIDATGSNSVTWIDPIINTAAQHGFVADGGIRQWLFINVNTEGNGSSGDNARTTGAINSASSSLTVASATGFSEGDSIVVQGAGANGADLFSTISTISGTTFTLADAASTTVSSLNVTNATYDDFSFTNNTGTGAEIMFFGGQVGGEGTGGKLRYGVDARILTNATFNGTRSSNVVLAYDPSRACSVFNTSAAIRRPISFNGDRFQSHVLGNLSQASAASEIQRHVVVSPQGKDFLIGLRDNNGDATGTTWGNLEARRCDANRSRFLLVNPTTFDLTIRHKLIPGNVSTGSGLGEGTAGFAFGSAGPIAGTWVQSDVVFNTGATSAGCVAAWQCVTAGTPGTWRPIAWVVGKAATASRPTLTAADIGVMFMDTTLDADGKPIWWNGTKWIDATGADA